MLLLAAMLGVVVGLSGAAFTWVWHVIDHQVWSVLHRPFDRVWVSTVVGLVIGLCLMRLHDPGSMATIVYHFHRWGRLPMRDNLPIQPVSLIGLVGGQSAGPEGALTQAGGSLGTWMARRCGHPHLERILTLAGMGAGFGAFLGAPIGGAILWLEMLHTRGLEYYEAVIPTIICSGVGYLVMLGLIGHGVVAPWQMDAGAPVGPWTPVVAIALGLLCGQVARGYALLFRGIGKAFNRCKLPLVAQTTIAGLCIGLLGYFFPLSYFYGGAQMHAVMALALPATAIVGLLMAKMVAACVTIRGHWQGGLIVPNMFMGALLGKLVAGIIPGLDPWVAMLVCMAAFNAAATQTPLASGLIVLALTGAGIPVPVFLASFAGFLAGHGVVLIEHKQSRSEPHNFHLEPREPQLVP